MCLPNLKSHIRKCEIDKEICRPYLAIIAAMRSMPILSFCKSNLTSGVPAARVYPLLRSIFPKKYRLKTN